MPGGDILGDGQDALVTDTNALASAGSRFYRIKLFR
jgi:hypothetical protein